MVHNPIYSEPLYDKVGGPPQIAIPPVPLSASDTQSINSSPPVGTPTPLLSTHYGHHGQKFIYEGIYNIHEDTYIHTGIILEGFFHSPSTYSPIFVKIRTHYTLRNVNVFPEVTKSTVSFISVSVWDCSCTYSFVMVLPASVPHYIATMFIYKVLNVLLMFNPDLLMQSAPCRQVCTNFLQNCGIVSCKHTFVLGLVFYYSIIFVS